MTRQLAILLIVCTSAIAVEIPATLEVDGQTYRGVTYQSHDASRLRIMHETGVAALPIANLPPDLQDKIRHEQSNGGVSLTHEKARGGDSTKPSSRPDGQTTDRSDQASLQDKWSKVEQRIVLYEVNYKSLTDEERALCDKIFARAAPSLKTLKQGGVPSESELAELRKLINSSLGSIKRTRHIWAVYQL
jgi:hypothetical protein